MVTTMETAVAGRPDRFAGRQQRTAPARWLAAALLVLLGMASIGAAEAGQVAIILDGSGSMAGRIGGVPKMQLAQQALGAALRDAPADIALGLVAYGHRQKGACSDVEVLARPTAGSLAAVTRAIGSVRAVGNTPMADSIRQAAASFSDPSGAGTIVLVTDGFENCDPDPCATLTALKQAQPGLRVHVVGFALNETDARALACVAEATGGKYLPATDTGPALVAALHEALSDAWYVEPEVPLPAAALRLPATAEQGLPFAIAFDGPVGRGDEIRISWIGTPPQSYIGAVFVRESGQPVHITAPLEVGRYEVRYWFADKGRVLAAEPLRVVPPIPALDAPERVEQGAEFDVAWKGPIHGRASVQIAAVGAAADAALASAVVSRTSGPAVLVAPLKAGRYELRYVAPEAETPILFTRAIEVVPATIALDVNGAVQAGADFTVNWAGPGAEGDEVHLARTGMADAAYLNGASVNPLFGNLVHLSAPSEAGAYELRYWSGAARGVVGRTALTIAPATAAMEAPAEVEAGARFEVLWTGPGGGFDRIELATAGTAPGRAEIYARGLRPSRPALLDAPTTAGSYELRYVAGVDRVVVATRPLKVTPPSATVTLTGPVEAGTPFTVTWAGPAAPFDELRVTLPAGDTRSWLSATRVSAPGAPLTLTAPAEAGAYVVSYFSARSGTVLASVGLDVLCTRSPPPNPPPALPAPPAAAPPFVVAPPAEPPLGPALAPPVTPPQGLTPLTPLTR